MKVFTSVKELRAELDRTEQSGIGFVPTMGALHAGCLLYTSDAADE